MESFTHLFATCVTLSQCYWHVDGKGIYGTGGDSHAMEAEDPLIACSRGKINHTVISPVRESVRYLCATICTVF